MSALTIQQDAQLRSQSGAMGNVQQPLASVLYPFVVKKLAASLSNIGSMAVLTRTLRNATLERTLARL